MKNKNENNELEKIEEKVLWTFFGELKNSVVTSIRQKLPRKMSFFFLKTRASRE